MKVEEEPFLNSSGFVSWIGSSEWVFARRVAHPDLSPTGNGSFQWLFLQLAAAQGRCRDDTEAGQLAEDPLCRSMDIDFSGRKHDAKTLLRKIFVYYNLELEECDLTDRDIYNAPEINCKVKYLCLRENKFAKPWQLLAIRFPLVVHLDMKRNKIPVERIGNSYEGNKLEHCTRIDVDERDYRSEKFFRAYCPSLKYVNGVKLEQIMGTQDVAATTGADDEGCTSVKENQMESGESSDDVDDWERYSDDFFI